MARATKYPHFKIVWTKPLNKGGEWVTAKERPHTLRGALEKALTYLTDTNRVYIFKVHTNRQVPRPGGTTGEDQTRVALLCNNGAY